MEYTQNNLYFDSIVHKTSETSEDLSGENINFQIKENSGSILSLLFKKCEFLKAIEPILTQPSSTKRTPESFELVVSLLYVGFLYCKTDVPLFGRPNVLEQVRGFVHTFGPTLDLFLQESYQIISHVLDIDEYKALQSVGMHSLNWTCLKLTHMFFTALFHPGTPSITLHSLHLIHSFLASPGTLFLTPKKKIKPVFGGGMYQHSKNIFVLPTSFGPIQLGSPPETIKSFLINGKEVPSIYVLPSTLYIGDLNYSELEFPIFYHAFVGRPRRKVTIFGTLEQIEQIRVILTESIFGPSHENSFLEEELAHSLAHIESAAVPNYRIDLIAESNRLRGLDCNSTDSSESLSHYCQFIPFQADTAEAVMERRTTTNHDENNGTGTLSIVKKHGLFCFYEDNELKGFIEQDSPHLLKESMKTCIALPNLSRNYNFVAPTLGLTLLGTSHGFDPKGRTTGFIIWINGKGIIVDPPYDTCEYLERNSINPRLVNKVILTHCHNDHDSGLLRKILHGVKIDLYTTKTINESYKRKAKAIIGEDLAPFYNFFPVNIRTPTLILGATFEFDYSFHTIPTIRFRLSYKGNTLSYSADTKYDPVMWAQMVRERVMTPEREMSLRLFLFDADTIIHEMGSPPIHTHVSELNCLPQSIKKKMLIVHNHDIPDFYFKEDPFNNKKIKINVTDLKRPLPGLENTIEIPVNDFNRGYSRASFRMQLLSNSIYFRKFSPPQICDLFEHLTQRSWIAGNIIVESGSLGDDFFIIESGKVEIFITNKDGDDVVLSTLLTGDAFGESALWRHGTRLRNASVRAITDTHLLILSTHDFRKISKVNIDHDLNKVNKYRVFLNNALAHSTFFKDLTKEQIDVISAGVDEEISFDSGEYIIRQGDNDYSMFIIRKGSVYLERAAESHPTNFEPLSPVTHKFKVLNTGESFGEISLFTGLPRTCSVRAREDTLVLRLKKEVFEEIISTYQHIRFVISRIIKERLLDNSRIDTLQQ